MRRRDTLADAIGTDAFLDIVANLVGILLILLMVIGVRMEDASKSTAAASTTEPPRELPLPTIELPEIVMPNVDEARLELSRLQQSIREADQRSHELAQSMRLQKLDRDNLMLAVTKAEHELEKRRTALDAAEREKVRRDLEIRTRQEEYRDLIGQLDTVKLAAQEKSPEVLQHIATPLAKTVFVREEHFRLKDGRLLYVPLNEMTKRLRKEAPKKMWKLESARQTTETIGPQEGFEMRYTLRRNRLPFQTESGLSAVREVIELDRFVMVPVGNNQGETVEEALAPTSTFQSRLSAWSPRDTIVTVWTYPDSFADFRHLKGELYKRGFLTAARPIPKNQLISGSPHGTRSAAQ